MPYKKAPNKLTAKERKLIEYILSHPEVSEMKAAMACGWSEGGSHKALNRPRVRKAIDIALAKRTEKIEEVTTNKVLLSIELLDEKLVEVITAPPHEKRNYADTVSALRIGYPRIGINLQPAAQVNMQTVIQPQIYQSKWMRKPEELPAPKVVNGE